MKKVWYITTDKLGTLIEKWINDNPHNNGYAVEWEIIDPNESGYPEIEKYFLSEGLKLGDKIIIHSKW